MKVTRLTGSATIFSVEGDTLDCSRAAAGCHFTTHAKKHKVGDDCPHCEGLMIAGKEFQGKLERRHYQCDTAAFAGIGQCSCESFTLNNDRFPLLSRLPRTALETMPQPRRDAARCKHILAARLEQGGGDSLDALLMALPQERSDGP